MNVNDTEPPPDRADPLSSVATTCEPVRAILALTLAAVEARCERTEVVTGVPSGFHRLDAITGGFQETEFVVIASRPSMGKTSLALNVVRNAAIEHGVPCLVFSPAMSKGAIVERLLSAESQVDSTRLLNGFLEQRDWSNLNTAASRIREAPIWVDDSGAPTLLELSATARRWRSESTMLNTCTRHGLIVVDCLQLITDDPAGGSSIREREIAAIARGLKALAVELRVPVIALSRLDAGVETRGDDRRPHLAHLREMGAIEHHADLIAFLYRDEVYYKDTADSGIVEVIVAKQRNGPVGTVRLAFRSEHLRFENSPDSDLLG